MGTRSITRIQKDGETLVAVYRQFDGYLSGQGRDLANILKDRKVVNGIRFGEEMNVFNGAGCLAANIICEMKREDNGGAGSVYIRSVDTEDEEYAYNINVKTKNGNEWSYSYEEYPTITVIRWGEEIFRGNSLEFLKFVEEDEERA